MNRGELDGDTYESEKDLLYNFDIEEFKKKNPDINIDILKHILQTPELIKKRRKTIKKMNPNMNSEEVLDNTIYELANRRQNYIDRKNKNNKQSRLERLFPDEDTEKAKPQFTDFSQTSQVKSEGFDWLKWSKTVSDLFTGKDEL